MDIKEIKLNKKEILGKMKNPELYFHSGLFSMVVDLMAREQLTPYHAIEQLCMVYDDMANYTAEKFKQMEISLGLEDVPGAYSHTFKPQTDAIHKPQYNLEK